MSHSDPNRVFYYAILASLALHALLLLGFPDLLSSARRAVESFPPPILARLIAPEPAAPPAAEKPPAPPPPVQTPKPSAAKPIAKPAPSPLPAPAVEPEPTPPAPPVASTEAAPPPTPAQPVPPAPISVAPSTSPAQSSQQSGEAAAAREARTISEYRVELIEAARRIKDRTRYPPIARDNNWTGNTNVSVAVPAGGAPAVSVRGTSGHQVLDQHALNIFRQATQEVAVPQALRGKAFVVEVRMDFTLKD